MLICSDSGIRLISTRQSVASACLATFVTASWMIRYVQLSISGCSRRSRRSTTSSLVMPVRREKPRRYQVAVSGRPRSSSIEGWSSWDMSRTDCSARSVIARASASRVPVSVAANVGFGNRQLELERRQRLTDFVVQLARDPPALVLLRLHQLRRQPRELAFLMEILRVLIADARLEPGGVARREERDHEPEQ